MATHDKIHGFTVPQGYFDNLQGRINSNIFIDNVKTKNTTSGYITPHLYFDNLAVKLSQVAINNNKSHKTAKIIPLYALKYAAAACILLVTTFAIYLNSSYPSKTQNQLTNISNEDIELYLQNETNAADMPLIIENVENTFLPVNQSISNQDLNEYLNESI
ncbi:MAG: hypothetical protein EAY66_08815 [Sphingobacteriales bacterium]|nr:MAG: hypothetical protein EAY66_08815 [Sphingobacteriales bacterium]